MTLERILEQSPFHRNDLDEAIVVLTREVLRGCTNMARDGEFGNNLVLLLEQDQVESFRLE